MTWTNVRHSNHENGRSVHLAGSRGCFALAQGYQAQFGALITEPGTAELDGSNLCSATSLCPGGTTVLYGRIEYSVGADAITTGVHASVLNDAGARLGATAIARFDSGRNSMRSTATWSGATRSSDTKPAGLFDLGFGYGRNLQG